MTPNTAMAMMIQAIRVNGMKTRGKRRGTAKGGPQ